MTYLILLKIPNQDDLKMILRNYKLGVTLDELVAMYKQATQEPMNFFKIDCNSANTKTKFSRKFSDFFAIDEKI
jgi:hypothetical protein